MSWKLFGINGIFVAFFSLLVVFLQAEKAQANLLSLSKAAPQPTVLSQSDIGDCACGPCAVFNAFQFGNATLNYLAAALPGDAPADKVRSLIMMYGGKPSLVSRREPRYLASGGMWEDDLAPFINDWLKNSHAAPVTGDRLILQGNETGREYLERVYNELNHSLAAGFPPVVNLQSYTARKNFFHHYWKWLDGHFVTVVAVQGNLPHNATQFSMSVADSETGRILRVIVNAGAGSSLATSGKQVKRSGKMTISQSRDNPYLMIQSPRLENMLEGSAAKSQPTICVIEYIAHR